MHNALYHPKAWCPPKKSEDFHADDVPSLTGKVALVTGGTRDVGLEVAKGLASARARVLILAEKDGRGEDALEHIRQHCRDKGEPHPEVASFECDLASLEDVKRVADAICQQESRLDILVCDAGVGLQPFELSEDKIDKHFAVTHLAHFLLINRLLPLLQRAALTPAVPADTDTSPEADSQPTPSAPRIVNILGGGGSVEHTIHVSYGDVAISVLIYLGIPLAAGILTRYVVLKSTSRKFFETRFLPWFSPLALIGLLYTIIVMFAYQGHHIVHNLGPVFRVFVPLVLYFVIMWTTTFTFVWRCGYRMHTAAEGELGVIRTDEGEGRGQIGHGGTEWSYEMAVVQSFTAASNNFELAIAVCIAVYGVGSDQALAATIGPLVEVPVLLALTWVALFLRDKLRWIHGEERSGIDA